MLSFLRKHQKLVFATAGLLVIFSMSFFGIASGSGSIEQKKNSVIGRAIDGSKMRSRPIDELVHFLNFSAHPSVGLVSAKDDVIINNVLKSGLGQMLVEAYFDELKGEIEDKLETYSRYKPYRHPSMQYINAENVWLRVAPELYSAYHSFLEEKEPLKRVRSLVDAFVAQSEFPEEQLRQILYFQERQFAAQVNDPNIVRGNLAVFGVHTPQELLGPKFLQLTAQFIHNGSIFAKQKGHKVSYEEARASLLTNVGDDLNVAVSRLHLSERKVVQLWQKILLFRRLFEEADGSIFLDALSYDHINRYMQESMDLSIYKMPEALAIGDFDKMMKFELYLDYVAKRGNDALIPLPSQYLSLDRVKSRCSKLLAKRYTIDVAELSRSEIALNVSFKELMEYETLHFEELRAKYPTLKEAGTVEEKLAQLDRLDEEVKHELDDYVREQIVAENEVWIGSALAGREAKERDLILNLDDRNTQFDGYTDNNELMSLLDKAYEKEETIDLLGAQTFYRVTVKDVSEDFDVLAFHEADEIGAMDRLLTDKLGREYSNARSANPALFKNASGEFKPLEEVRDDVGKFVFSEALTQLRNYLVTQGETPSENIDTLASYRMHHYLNEALTAIQDNLETDLYLLDEEEHVGFEEQFKLVQNSESIARSVPSALSDEQIFRMKESEWSSVSLLPEQGLSFFHVDAKRIDDDVRKAAMEEGFALLSDEACRVLLKDLLSEIQSHGAIHLDEESA